MAKKTFARSVAWRVAVAFMLVIALLAGGNAADAAELRILSAAARQSGFKEIAADRVTQRGYRPSIFYIEVIAA